MRETNPNSTIALFQKVCPKLKCYNLERFGKNTKLHFDSIWIMSNVTIVLSVLGQSRRFLVAHTPPPLKKITPFGCTPLYRVNRTNNRCRLENIRPITKLAKDCFPRNPNSSHALRVSTSSLKPGLIGPVLY
jgi:hypothetical protein